MVVDAGVVCKWLFEEPGSDAAQALLARDEVLAPELVYAEVGNVVWKRARFDNLSETDASRVIAELAQVPIVVADCRPLLPQALEIGVQYHRTFYDSLYLALALALDCELITLDQRLINAMIRTPFENRVRLLTRS